ASTTSRWTWRRWGNRRLPPRSAPRGGSLPRLPFPLAAGRHPGAGARRPAAVGGRDRGHQPPPERGAGRAALVV
ncbi:MAG: hypothetical protein AVDCRST_MAG73-727, partial [uncultured Thermomicrobiales bacterium]